ESVYQKGRRTPPEIKALLCGSAARTRFSLGCAERKSRLPPRNTRGNGMWREVLKSPPPPYCTAPLFVPVLNVFGAPVTRVVLSANRAYPPPTLAHGEIAALGTNITRKPGVMNRDA